MEILFMDNEHRKFVVNKESKKCKFLPEMHRYTDPLGELMCYQFRCLVNRGTMGVNSLPDCYPTLRDLNPGPSAPESSTLTTRLPSHQC